jgi:MFS family permease
MPIHPLVIWALGVTQIIGYGTLYYSFSVLSPLIGAEFGWSPEGVFGALSVSLLAGGLLAPAAGRAFDRYGAARIMVLGSIVVAAMLAATAFAPAGVSFALALIILEAASTLVLYAAAFAALVEIGGHKAQRSITHLTLIAGFASTLFWPLTDLLSVTLSSWREVYLAFAGLNLGVCVPLHFWLARYTRNRAVSASAPVADVAMPRGALPAERYRLALVLLMIGFAVEGFLLSGLLMHIIPLLDALGLAASSVLITTLFGPAQVLGRLTNMVFGRDLRQTQLAVIAALLLQLGLAVLAGSAPLAIGAVLFAILFGLGSGLTSIVSGSLPLELYGRDRYGARLGWLSSARQVASATAPFLVAVMIGSFGTVPALLVCVLVGTVPVGVFAWVARLAARPAADSPAPVGQGSRGPPGKATSHSPDPAR